MVLQKYVPWVPKDPNTHRVFGALQTLAILRQRNLFGMVSLRHPVQRRSHLGKQYKIVYYILLHSVNLIHRIPWDDWYILPTFTSYKSTIHRPVNIQNRPMDPSWVAHIP